MILPSFLIPALSYLMRRSTVLIIPLQLVVRGFEFQVDLE
jgi:hypothetical protein